MAGKRAAFWVGLGVIGAIVVLGLPAAQGEHSVMIEGGKFVPREEIIGQGDTVVWRHADGGAAHSVTADNGSFDSHPNCSASAPDQCLREGRTFSHTFTSQGRYQYYSRPHGGPDKQGMYGAIVVVARGGGPSSTTTR